MDSKVFNCVRLVSCLHRLFLAIALQNTWCLADQIVHLERPSNPPNGELLSEPWFNPNNITVSVGEQIHFVARFASQRAYRPAVCVCCQLLLKTRVILHLNGSLPSPLMMRRASTTEVIQLPIILNVGIFSGYFLVDGTWNGSTFTLTVTDADPHFLYFSTYRQEANGQFCPGLGGWDSHFDLPVNQSVLFAINPVLPGNDLSDITEHDVFFRGIQGKCPKCYGRANFDCQCRLFPSRGKSRRREYGPLHHRQ